MVEQQPSKLMTRVRFPSPAPFAFLIFICFLDLFRASLLKIAQKWHDLAEIDDRDAARPHAVQREIGRELRTHYELPKELPHRVFALLMQLDAEQSGKTRF
jgi:hypothetical protein